MLTCGPVALGKRITHISLDTNTQGYMVPHFTIGIDSAQSRAGILTLPPDARLVTWAISVDNALGPAVGRGADHFWQARALTAVANNTWWVGVGSTRVGVTWVLIDDRFNG